MEAPSRRAFWPLVAIGTLLGAASAACLTVAYSNRAADAPTPAAQYEGANGWTNYVPLVAEPRADPVPWLVAGVALVVAAVLAFVVAASRR